MSTSRSNARVPALRRVSLGVTSLLLLAACSDQPVSPASTPEGAAARVKSVEATSVTAFGAVPNDNLDDAAAFQAAFNAARNVHVPAGDWNLASTVNVPSDTRVHGDGVTSRLVASAPGLYAMLDAVGPNDGPVADVVVEHLNFQGGAGTRIHAFRARWGQRIRFSDNRVTGIGVINVDNSDGVEVLRNTGVGTVTDFHHAIELNFARNVVIRSNNVQNYSVGIQWWGGVADSRDPAFTRAKLTGGHTIDQNTVYNTSAGIWGGNGEHIMVTANDVQVCADVCLDAEGSDDVRFIGNTAKYAGFAVMSTFFYSTNILFQGNFVEQDGLPHGPLPPSTNDNPWHNLFALVSVHHEPDQISVELRGNTLSYTGSGVGLLTKSSSRLMVIDDNDLFNTVIDMAHNNNGAVRVTNNRVNLSVNPQRPAIYVGSNHNTPSDPVAGTLHITGNTVRSSVPGGRGIEAWQWAWGLTLNTFIQNNWIEGFDTSILYRNDNQSHNWTITGNTRDGTITRGGNWTPNATVSNNPFIIEDPATCYPALKC